MVVVEAGADANAVAEAAQRGGGRVKHAYERGIKGFALEATESDAQKLAKDPRVELVEEDAVVTATTSWALDRIDQRLLPLNGTFVSTGAGAGVTAYVVDTGILAAHRTFGGRVREGYSVFADGGATSDCNGHGTHVAGLIGGAEYGVAKSVTLVPVRVLDCDGAGSISAVMAGLDWILRDRASATGRAVANLSLGGAASVVMDKAVEALVNAGVVTVVAAGNEGRDACKYSPARVPVALTVGATNSADQQASFSNFGSCVDLFAPGVDILSASHASPTASTLATGTSASAPLAAGVAALYLEKYPASSPGAIAQTVVSQATPGVLSNLGVKSINLLLFSQVGSLDAYVKGDRQLLADPSFDFGSTFWTADICTVLNPTGCPPGLDDPIAMSLPSKSGNTHASLGGNTKSTVATSEIVNIPADARSASLDFYLWVVTKEKGDKVEDVLRVEILDASGELLETVGTFSNLDEGPTYTLRTIDLTKYRGMDIRISFATDQDKGPSTWFLVDDVELNVKQ